MFSNVTFVSSDARVDKLKAALSCETSKWLTHSMYMLRRSQRFQISQQRIWTFHHCSLIISLSTFILRSVREHVINHSCLSYSSWCICFSHFFIDYATDLDDVETRNEKSSNVWLSRLSRSLSLSKNQFEINIDLEKTFWEFLWSSFVSNIRRAYCNSEICNLRVIVDSDD